MELIPIILIILIIIIIIIILSPLYTLPASGLSFSPGIIDTLRIRIEVFLKFEIKKLTVIHTQDDVDTDTLRLITGRFHPSVKSTNANIYVRRGSIKSLNRGQDVIGLGR